MRTRRTTTGIGLIVLAATLGAACGSSRGSTATPSGAPPGASESAPTESSIARPTDRLAPNQIRVYALGSANAASQNVVVTGAFADAGQLTVTGPMSTLTLAAGTIQVDLTEGVQAEQALFANLGAITDPATCGVYGSYTSTVKLVSGTGAYATVTGTIAVTTTEAGVFPKKPDSSCNEDADPIGFLSIGEGLGTVSGL